MTLELLREFFVKSLLFDTLWASGELLKGTMSCNNTAAEFRNPTV